MFVFKQKTAYEMRISDWSSDVCSSDLDALLGDPDDGERWLHAGEGVVRHGSSLVEDEPRLDVAVAEDLDCGRRGLAHHLFIAAEAEPDVLLGGEALAEQTLDGFADAGQAALVVEGPAAPEDAVVDLGAEGGVQIGRAHV